MSTPYCNCMDLMCDADHEYEDGPSVTLKEGVANLEARGDYELAAVARKFAENSDLLADLGARYEHAHSRGDRR